MKEVKLTKRQMRTLFRKVFKSAENMSCLLHEKKKRNRLFIEDNALEYIMRIYTDRAFGDKPKNKKYYYELFPKRNKEGNELIYDATIISKLGIVNPCCRSLDKYRTIIRSDD